MKTFEAVSNMTAFSHLYSRLKLWLGFTIRENRTCVKYDNKKLTSLAKAFEHFKVSHLTSIQKLFEAKIDEDPHST